VPAEPARARGKNELERALAKAQQALCLEKETLAMVTKQLEDKDRVIRAAQQEANDTKAAADRKLALAGLDREFAENGAQTEQILIRPRHLVVREVAHKEQQAGAAVADGEAQAGVGCCVAEVQTEEQENVPEEEPTDRAAWQDQFEVGMAALAEKWRLKYEDVTQKQEAPGEEDGERPTHVQAFLKRLDEDSRILAGTSS